METFEKSIINYFTRCYENGMSEYQIEKNIPYLRKLYRKSKRGVFKITNRISVIDLYTYWKEEVRDGIKQE